MHDVIFREYDIRGVVGTEFFIEQVYDMTDAILRYFIRCNPLTNTVVVGRDVRTHSEPIYREICRCLLDNGCTVLDIGVCTSPMVYYALSKLSAQTGIMVTASHNAKEYNGLKLYVGTQMIHGSALQEIRKLYKDNRHNITVQKFLRGTQHHRDITSEYIASLCHEFEHLQYSSLPLVFDCANGAAGVVLPRLLEQMRCTNVQILYPELDGTFPHHSADPIIEENMKDLANAVQSRNAIVGIGFDGDADRMCAVDHVGTLLSGDMLLALFAQHLDTAYMHRPVIYDVNASEGLSELLSVWGMTSVMAPCGHAHIKSAMQKYNAVLGGEISCHFLFEDRGWSVDDGIYAALRLIEILHKDPNALDAIMQMFPARIRSPRYRLPCAEQDKLRFVQAVYEYCKHNTSAELSTVDGVRIKMAGSVGLVRASNTQAALCFTFEANTYDALYDVQRLVANALAPIYTHNLYETFKLK